MHPYQERERLLARAEPYVRAAARRLVGRARLSRSDVADLEQELRLGLWSRLHRFDARRGDEAAFLKVVINRLASKFTRRSRAARRDVRREVPLTDPEEVTDSAGRRAGDEVDARLDVADALARLSPELARLAELLRTESLTSAAKTLGISRHAARRFARGLLARFRSAGLDAYLRNSPPVRAPLG